MAGARSSNLRRERKFKRIHKHAWHASVPPKPLRTFSCFLPLPVDRLSWADFVPALKPRGLSLTIFAIVSIRIIGLSGGEKVTNFVHLNEINGFARDLLDSDKFSCLMTEIAVSFRMRSQFVVTVP